MNNYRQALKDFAFSILDKRKQRGFHLLNDLRYLSEKSKRPIELIFDVGANIGQSTIEFKKYFPKSKIHAFEPVVGTCNQLSENTEHLRDVVINNFALSNSLGEKTIILDNEILRNSLRNEILDTSVASQKTQIFKIKTIDHYCKLNAIDHIDLLKTDTEGFELEVLQGATEAINNKSIQFIVAETTFDLNSDEHTKFNEINNFLWKKGYGLIGFYDFAYKSNTLAIAKYCNVFYAKM